MAPTCQMRLAELYVSLGTLAEKNQSFLKMAKMDELLKFMEITVSWYDLGVRLCAL